MYCFLYAVSLYGKIVILVRDLYIYNVYFVLLKIFHSMFVFVKSHVFKNKIFFIKLCFYAHYTRVSQTSNNEKKLCKYTLKMLL